MTTAWRLYGRRRGVDSQQVKDILWHPDFYQEMRDCDFHLVKKKLPPLLAMRRALLSPFLWYFHHKYRSKNPEPTPSILAAKSGTFFLNHPAFPTMSFKHTSAPSPPKPRTPRHGHRPCRRLLLQLQSHDIWSVMCCRSRPQLLKLAVNIDGCN